jgi:hypothetical protein
MLSVLDCMVVLLSARPLGSTSNPPGGPSKLSDLKADLIWLLLTGERELFNVFQSFVSGEGAIDRDPVVIAPSEWCRWGDDRREMGCSLCRLFGEMEIDFRRGFLGKLWLPIGPET